jgi:dTDP-4-dehydrorhamnose 3,5-epimerase-like enzyme
MSFVINGVETMPDDAAAISIGESFRRLEFSQHLPLQVHGMHFSSSDVQISCVIGRLMVAICDLRVSSSSCMKVQLLELHAFHGDGISSVPSSVVIPAGCARGIVSILDSIPSSAITLTGSPSQLDDSALPSTIAWNDPSLAIAWPPLCRAAPSCESYPHLPSSFKASISHRPSVPLTISNSPIRSSSDPYTPSVILLSGGAGFIGSHVIRHLIKKYPDYTVINLDVLDHCSSLNNLSDVAEFPNYRFVHGDICNLDLVDYVFKINQARADCMPSSSHSHGLTYSIAFCRWTP